MGAIISIAVKDLRLLMRDRAAAFFTLVFPLLFGVVFGLIFQQAFGGGAGAPVIEVAIVDLDGTDLSRAFAGTVVDMGELKLVEVADAADGEDRVRRGRLAACVVIPAGFEESMGSVLAGGTPRVECIVDPSRAAESGVLRGLLTGAGFRTLTSAWQRPDMVGRQLEGARASLRGAEGVSAVERGLMGAFLESADRMFGTGAAERGGAGLGLPGSGGGGGDGGFSPIEVAVRSPERAGGPDGIRSAFELTYPQAAAWALVGCVTGFGLSLVGERSSGTLTRLAVAPIRRESVVVGKALACFVAAMVVLGAQRVLFMLPFFGVRGGDPVLEAVTLVLVAFAFTGVMAALATVATSTGGAEGAVRATLLILALLGGAGVPLMFFQGWMRLVTMASPFRWAIAALEGSTWRGWTAGELAGTWGVLGTVGALGMVFGVVRFQKWRVAG
jgi:ABC-2 type transport system permease protein